MKITSTVARKKCNHSWVTVRVRPWANVECKSLKIGATKCRLNSSVITNVEPALILLRKLHFIKTRKQAHVPLAIEMPKYSARRALRWQLRKIEREDSLYIQLWEQLAYQTRQLLLQVTCLTVLLLGNNNGTAILSSGASPSQSFDSCFDSWIEFAETLNYCRVIKLANLTYARV